MQPEYSGRELRQALSARYAGATAARPLGARSGVRPGTPDSTATMTGTTWTLKPHAGVLDLQASAAAGVYEYAVDANETGSITAASGSIIRKDILYIQLSDPAEGDGTSTPGATVGYLAGTVASTAPATPARSMRLATITVPVSGGGSPTITFDAPFTAGAGGIVPTRNGTERTALAAHASAAGPIITDCLDRPGTLLRSTGGAWSPVGVKVRRQSADGVEMPDNATPVDLDFMVSVVTNGSGSAAIGFLETFAARPIVQATTITGTGVAVIIPSDTISTTGCSLNWPGVTGVAVRAHVSVRGWVV